MIEPSRFLWFNIERLVIKCFHLIVSPHREIGKRNHAHLGRGKFMNERLCRLFFILVLVASAAASGCGSKVNQANFDKIQTDMTLEEVEKILGPPTESSGVSLGGFSGNTARWESGDSAISIQFLNGKVMAKQFLKSKDKPPRVEQE
jgi:hypothetical protein